MAALGMLFVLLSCTGVAIAGSDCYSLDSYYNNGDQTMYYSHRSFYCSEGCCGGYTNTYCCQAQYVDYYDYTSYVSDNIGGIIAGIVIGSLVGIGLFIAFVVFICVYCVNSNRRSTPGRVVTSSPTGNPVTYVNTRK
ncbi:uncharacterized protein LOC132545213 [Ylistrum balloti]|uniref:uncharacterized protein LOC132545213 n=1 Tax=Ylistrum balloti TaxID=509963 RepID=UPI0029058DD0|nr:uncharacterized protein LOC132545213 [Ylistrum balloti]